MEEQLVPNNQKEHLKAVKYAIEVVVESSLNPVVARAQFACLLLRGILLISDAISSSLLGRQPLSKSWKFLHDSIPPFFFNLFIFSI